MKNKILIFLILFALMSNMAKSQCQIVNLATNGDFSLGNTGFTSSITAGAACAAHTYTVNNNFTTKCPGWPNVTGHTTPGPVTNNFLIIDGLDVASGTSAVWNKTVTVCAQKTYTFSFWSNRVHNEPTDPMNLTMSINGTGMGAPPDVITSDLVFSTWVMHQRVWSAPASGTVQIQIRQNSFVASGKRDFGVDDVIFASCCPTITAVSSNSSICSGSCVTLSASGGSSFTWSPGGATGPSVTVCPSVTTTYTVSGYSGGCAPCLVTSTITINVTPSVIISPDFVLSGTTIMGNTTDYWISAIPNVITSWPTSSFWWEVSEVDLATGTTIIPGTTMTNAETWWYNPFVGNNTFPGYDHTTSSSSWPVTTPMAPYPSPYTGSGYSTNPPPGIFGLDRRYRITRATWGDCTPWTTMSKSIYICSSCKSTNGPVFTVENDPYAPAMPQNLLMATNIGTIKMNVQKEILISPNPNNGLFTISMNSDLAKDIYVYDVAGKIVYENKNVSAKTIDININNQPIGIYIVRITDGKSSTTQKIIKQ